MKKVYQKPEIAFDCFTMSTNIAAGCAETNVTHSSGQYGCGYSAANGLVVIFSTEMGCSTTEAVGSNNTICYHPPAGYNLFTS